MKLQIRSVAGGMLVLAVAAVALAACGGGSGDDSSGTGDAMSAYQKCLSDNGVTLPSNGARASGGTRPSGMPTDRPTVRPSGSAMPSGGQGQGQGGFMPQGVDATKWAQAQEKCSSLRPTGQPSGYGNGQGGPGQGGPGGGMNAAYRNCLLEHGVTLQDGQQLNTADAKVAEAVKACEVLKPSASPSN